MRMWGYIDYPLNCVRLLSLLLGYIFQNHIYSTFISSLFSSADWQRSWGNEAGLEIVRRESPVVSRLSAMALVCMDDLTFIDSSGMSSVLFVPPCLPHILLKCHKCPTCQPCYRQSLLANSFKSAMEFCIILREPKSAMNQVQPKIGEFWPIYSQTTQYKCIKLWKRGFKRANMWN